MEATFQGLFSKNDLIHQIIHILLKHFNSFICICYLHMTISVLALFFQQLWGNVKMKLFILPSLTSL